MLLAPLVDNRKGEHRELLHEGRREGFARVRIDGKVVRGEEVPALDKKKKHDIELVVDRLAVLERRRERLRHAPHRLGRDRAREGQGRS